MLKINTFVCVCVCFLNMFYSDNVVIRFVFSHHSTETLKIKFMCVPSRTQSKRDKFTFVRQNVSLNLGY